MKRRKRGARRIFAGAMAALMVLSAADVSGWGVMNAKAEETTTRKVPQTLSIMDESQQFISIIMNGELQDDKVSGNANTLYEGTNWHYDSEKNQLVLQNASVQHITVEGGDLTVLLSGENTVSGNITSKSSNGEHTLELKSDNSGSLTVGTRIGDGTISDGSGKQMNLKITDATVHAPEISCKGSLKIENSHVIVSSGDSTNYAINTGCDISIANSYVEAKIGKGQYAISSKNGLVVSNSQIMACNSGGYEDQVIDGGSFSDAVVTKQYGNNVTKSVVYGTASLIEKLTIPNNGTIVFMQGASITNQELLAVEDGANILVNGYMIEDVEASGDTHIHNKDGDITYTWKDDNEHIKNVSCKDCPIGYATKETGTHSIGENGFCTLCDAYQPAKLTTDKYDINGDDSKDAVYEISNAGQLYWFAGLVNGTLSGVTQNTSANAVLTKDIVVNKNVLKPDGTVNEGTFKEWTPIATSASPYTGIFEGQNHTISGLYFKQEASFVGLFSVNSGKIANVGILDSYFYGQPYKGWQVGGVCGFNTNQGAITNCYNTGIVRGSDTVGGVCGSNYGTITNCSNKGNVGEDDESVGGVCGSNYGTITNCNNAGIVSGKMYVGGVCGKNSNGGTVTNCNNTGEVRGTSQYIGGLSGDNDSSSITNCNNTGEVKATGKFVGGLSGGNYNNGTITNCYYDSTVYTGAAIGDDMGTTKKVEGKTTEQYKTGEVAYLLQDSQSDTEIIWGQTVGTDNYPTLGGAKVYKNAIYEGCEGNPGDAVSYAYSNTKKNTYGDHPDADSDGRCDNCSAIIDGIGAKLAGYSLSLTGNIGVNFYMELSDQIIADKDAYMQFTLPNGTVTKVLVSEAQTNTTINAEKTYYRFSCEVSSYEMTQDIKAQMFDGNGKCGKEYTYTVRDYAQYLINHVDLYVDAVPFAMAMLNYGACSQKYFNKAVDELANKYLTDDELEIPDRFEGYIDNYVATKAENGVLGQFAGLSMVLKSETTLNIFYEPKEGIDVSKLTFSVDGKEITPVKRGQYYILSLKNIKANELGNSKTFTVTDGTNTLSGEYCALMYCYQVLQAKEGTYADDLVTLVKAFSDYAYKAKDVCRSN